MRYWHIGRGWKAVEARLSSLGSNLLMLIPNNSAAGSVRLSAGSISRLTLEDVKAVARCNPNVVNVDGNVSGSAQVVYVDKNWNTSVTGALPSYEGMRNSKPYYGRFYTTQENQNEVRASAPRPDGRSPICSTSRTPSINELKSITLDFG